MTNCLKSLLTPWALGLIAVVGGTAAAARAEQPSIELRNPPPRPKQLNNAVKTVGVRPAAASQEFTAPAVLVPVEEFSIADLYRASAGQSGAFAATTVTYRCPIGLTGKVMLPLCAPAKRGTALDPVAKGLILAAARRIDLPTYAPVRLAESGQTERFVTLDFQIPGADLPAVDLAAGPLVERTSIAELSGPLPFTPEYPSRAMREEAEGRSTLECQVQPDLSVICRQISFEPPEAAALFADASERVLGAMRVSPQLTDGREARGVRFQLVLNYRLN